VKGMKEESGGKTIDVYLCVIDQFLRDLYVREILVFDYLIYLESVERIRLM